MTRKEFESLKPGEIVQAINNSSGYSKGQERYTNGSFYKVLGISPWESIRTIDNRGNQNGWPFSNFKKLTEKEQETVKVLFKVVE